MRISTLFRRLSLGELSNLAISDSGSGEIVPEKQPQLVQFANDGLMNLFGRFQLLQKELIINQVESLTIYPLRLEYALSTDADVPYAFIQDSMDNPFTGDVLKILSVHDEQGIRVLNDIEDMFSLFTPKPDVLQIPEPQDGEPLSVIYQARHPALDDRPEHLANQEIWIPSYLEKPLQLYVAYEVFCNMNGQENIAKGQEYLAHYNALCTEILDQDLLNQSHHTSHTKLEQRGFV